MQSPTSQLPEDGSGYSDTLVPVDPRRIIGILRRRMPLILLITVASIGVAAAFAYRPATLYRSTAVIRLRDVRQAVSGGLATQTEQPAAGMLVNPMQSLIEVLASRGVAGTVIDSVPLLRLRTYGVTPTLFRDVQLKPGR